MTVLDLAEFRNLPKIDDESVAYGRWQLHAIRAAMLFGLVGTVVWLAVVALFMVLALAFARRLMIRLWHSACLAAASLMACFVGLFSVRFGVTILCLYLLIHAGEGEGRLIAFLRARVQKAFARV
jgi:hypothetical protein